MVGRALPLSPDSWRVGEGRGYSGERRAGGSAGSPRGHGARSGGFRGQVQDDRSGVRLPEDEHFRVLKGGDERDWGGRERRRSQAESRPWPRFRKMLWAGGSDSEQEAGLTVEVVQWRPGP